MTTDHGLVSIITPNHNCGKYLAQTIESVLAQTYTNWEMLIQDDCSTDDSLQVAMEYAAKDRRIRVERNTENMGAARTRNRAIRRSSGVWLAFLDSDDLWLPDKLQYQLDWMAANGADFSFTRYEHISETGEPTGVTARVVDRLSYRRLLRHCWPGCLTVMYRQNPQEKVYSPDIRRNNDHSLFLRVLATGLKARGIDRVTARYRLRSGSISRNKFKMVQPYLTVVHDFERKSWLTAWWCVLTHTFIKTFRKYDRGQK